MEIEEPIKYFQLRDHFPDLIAAAFVLIYAFIQWHVIHHPGVQDDVVSARVQDVVVMIVSFYFGSAHKKRSGKIS